jgi:hypothetical protein
MLDDPNDRTAPPGSAGWARWALQTAKQERYGMYREVAGLQQSVKSLERHAAWKLLGYRSMEALARQALDLDAEQLAAIRTAHPGALVGKVIARATVSKPQAARGEVGKGRPADRCSNATSIGRGADYLTARIARDRPDILERMKAGEFKSARAAGIAAGIVKVPTRLEVTQRAFGRLTPAERRAFRTWLAGCDGG